MRLRILVPAGTVLDREVDKVVAESATGSFCIEPRHVDYVAPLVAGILAHWKDGEEAFAGVGRGVLVKVGEEVLVSVHEAVAGADLGHIRGEIRRMRERREEGEEQAQAVGRRLESTLVRRFMDLDERMRERA